MIGAPVMMYVFAALLSAEMSAAIKTGAASSVLDLAMGGCLFLMRYGAMVFGALGAWASFFGSPKVTAPKWMICR